MERDITAATEKGEPLDFNSHAHVERDSTKLNLVQFFDNFNSHAHVERDEKKSPPPQSDEDFNSHAHVERDAAHNLYTCGTDRISTHTLTWSVTSLMPLLNGTAGFQLTRSRGA